MPGKNQQKRIDKHKKHAVVVWAKKQLTAATAMTLLTDALADFEDNQAELTSEQIAEISAKASEQIREIERFVMLARDNFVTDVGSAYADEVMRRENS
jgi:hypothetical protein